MDPRPLRTAAILIAAFGLFSATAPPPAAARSMDRDVGLLLRSMNAVRIANGLRALRLDVRLCEIAYEHAVDMERRKYVSHSTPEGLSPFARMAAKHYRFGYAGENLALDESVRRIFDDFLTSSEHRSNMLGPHYARVGIASLNDPPEGVIVVEDFSD